MLRRRSTTTWPRRKRWWPASARRVVVARPPVSPRSASARSRLHRSRSPQLSSHPRHCRQRSSSSRKRCEGGGDLGAVLRGFQLLRLFRGVRVRILRQEARPLRTGGPRVVRFSHVCFPPVAVERSCFVVGKELAEREGARSKREGERRSRCPSFVRTWKRAGRSVRTQRWLL